MSDPNMKTTPWMQQVIDYKEYTTLVVELMRYEEAKDKEDQLNAYEKLFTWYSSLGFKSMTKAILHHGIKEYYERTVSPVMQLKFQNGQPNPYAKFKNWEVSEVGPLIRMVFNKSFLQIPK